MSNIIQSVYTSNSPADTRAVAAEITSAVVGGVRASSPALPQPTPVLLLNGELGAGKTEFAKGVAAALGIADYVTSPTFALLNDYGNMLHYDLYRIDGDYDDLYNIGFFDSLERRVFTVIEWWKWETAVLNGCCVVEVNIDKISDDERSIGVNML